MFQHSMLKQRFDPTVASTRPVVTYSEKGVPEPITSQSNVTVTREVDKRKAQFALASPFGPLSRPPSDIDATAKSGLRNPVRR